ncbi:MAG: YqjF family protein [Planctomycetales bacterium]
MPLPALPIDRLSPTCRPRAQAIGYHTWSNLLFVHWRFPAALVQGLLPPDLSLDTWEGEAWIGLVPFYMAHVRPWWSPPIPGISYFQETNVRTYVHYRGRDPGVWFFSLEAANSLAVRVARWLWSLPYHRAQMSLIRQGNHVQYTSHRLWPGTPGAGCQIKAAIGDPFRSPIEPADVPPRGVAIPGTLEHFLIERYILYASRDGTSLLSGRVHHRPYPLRTVQIEHLEETLLTSAGLPPTTNYCHTLFSDGVDVEIFPLTPVAP